MYCCYMVRMNVLFAIRHCCAPFTHRKKWSKNQLEEFGMMTRERTRFQTDRRTKSLLNRNAYCASLLTGDSSAPPLSGVFKEISNKNPLPITIAAVCIALHFFAHAFYFCLRVFDRFYRFLLLASVFRDTWWSFNIIPLSLSDQYHLFGFIFVAV